MKSLSTSRRILALALCLMMVLAIAVPALAANVAAFAAILADNTPVYSATNLTTVIGVFNKGDIVAIESQGANYYVIRQNPTTTAIGYISKTAVDGTKLTAGLTSTMTQASMKSPTGAVVSGTASSGSAGVIFNCRESVNFRATASSSGSKLGTLKLNEQVTILGEENGFYKVTNSAGTTGYVSKTYCKYGTAGSASTGSTATSGSGQAGTIVNCKSSVNFRAGASASSQQSTNIRSREIIVFLCNKMETPSYLQSILIPSYRISRGNSTSLSRDIPP